MLLLGNMTILSIETSCDETAAAVVKNGREVLSNVIYSQIDVHALYGGVVPEIASRSHIKKITQICDIALREADVSSDMLSAVAVTYGPGLVGSLLVGLSFAKSFAFANSLPLIGVHHIKGHILAVLIEHPKLKPPFFSLVVSGGHTHLVLVEDFDDFKVIGRTVDDAAGEAFDKVARVLGLPYPGGPAIEKIAKSGDASAFNFPKANVDGAPYDFSFSGLKSAVINTLHKMAQTGVGYEAADVAASFQRAVIEVLLEKSLTAYQEFALASDEPIPFTLCGGVASNGALRNAFKDALAKQNIPFFCPSPIYCTDNAAMIGVAGSILYNKKAYSGLDLNAVPSLGF